MMAIRRSCEAVSSMAGVVAGGGGSAIGVAGDRLLQSRETLC